MDEAGIDIQVLSMGYPSIEDFEPQEAVECRKSFFDIMPSHFYAKLPECPDLWSGMNGQDSVGDVFRHRQASSSVFDARTCAVKLRPLVGEVHSFFLMQIYSYYSPFSIILIQSYSVWQTT